MLSGGIEYVSNSSGSDWDDSSGSDSNSDSD